MGKLVDHEGVDIIDDYDDGIGATARDDHLRAQALAAANVYAVHRADLTPPFDVVERAAVFYRFLKGEHAGTVQ